MHKLGHLLTLLSITLSLIVVSTGARFGVEASGNAGQTFYAGQTYFVSFSDGHDDNDGLSEGAPWASVSKVNSADLGSGDNVLFGGQGRDVRLTRRC